jgi:hypothetical protein
MLLTVDQQRRALGCIHAHLRAGGQLIVDIFDPLYDLLAAERFTPPREFPAIRNAVTGHAVTVTVPDRVNDHVRQIAVERWCFREVATDGTIVREEEEHLELRWIFRYEMQHLLEVCGFVVEEEFSDYRGAPPSYGKEQILVARRI